MGKILISEEEKRRILGMHVDKGYSSLMSEQGVKPTPPAPVDKTQKAIEMNNQYFTTNPTGQVMAKNQAFVKFINDNKINIQASNLQLAANKSQATMTGPDGKLILVNFATFPGTIPSDIIEKYQAAYNSVRNKVNELDSNPQIKQNQCFDITLMKRNPKGNQQFCRTYWKDFDTFVQSNDYENLTSLRQMKQFLDSAPKWKTA